MATSFLTFSYGSALIAAPKSGNASLSLAQSDIFHVQRLLDHKNIQNTTIYITLQNSVFQAKNGEFHTAVARNLEEACKLVEIGFEYICAVDGAKVFKRRK